MKLGTGAANVDGYAFLAAMHILPRLLLFIVVFLRWSCVK